jgi:hypothetical protein
MKILCVSDYIDPLVYSVNIKDRFKDVSLVLSCGDLPLDYYDYIVSNLNKPLLFIFGNHNLTRIADFDARYKMKFPDDLYSGNPYKSCGAQYISGKVLAVKGVLIAGLGGSMRYNNGINQFSDLGMFCYMLKLLPSLLWNKITLGRFLDILITHAPPYGIHDWKDVCHRGFKAFLWFMRVFKPKYLVHGHIHLYTNNEERTSAYTNTVIVNAFKHYIIEIEESKEKTYG